MSNLRPHLSIDNWLEKLDLTVYQSLLKDYHGVEEILWMSERDLKNMGIKNGSHRARMSTSLAVLKDKYEKSFRENQNNFCIDGNTLSIGKGNKSFSSISPVKQICLEKTQSGVRSWPSSGPSSSHNTKHSSPRTSMDGFVGTEASAEELKRALEKELSLDNSDLRSYAWYHGTILRQRAEELVTHNGDFLVRDCISQPGDFVITCKWENVPLHFIIKKVILQPDTVYERIQYCFENDSFDSIPDFITYYVGSKCPLSETSGAVISRPVNRSMPLSYYASRYGNQCLIHYAAKALEKIPPTIENNSPSLKISTLDSSPKVLAKPKEFNSFEDKSGNINETCSNNKVKNHFYPSSNLMRVGSDPMLSPNTERRKLEHRPNSGTFSSEIKAVSMTTEDKPPPKPSRVPSKRCAQRPLVIQRDRQISIDEDDAENGPSDSIPIRGISPAHNQFKRQISETRFSFLDRPSVSDDGSVIIESNIKPFTLPTLDSVSLFDPQNFRTAILNAENTPLEGTVLFKVKQAFLSATPKALASNMTRMDLEIAKNWEDTDLGLGVSNGLELLFLPQGGQLQKDLLERSECLKLFVAVLILTSPTEEERVKLLSKWIEVALETKTGLGNFYGFASIMLGLTLPEIAGLHSTWLALRHSYTDVAFIFETKMRPVFKALLTASSLEAPNTCLPYILSLICIFQKHEYIMKLINVQPYDAELVCNEIVNFNLPGSQSAGDYGLQLLADHLELGRNIMQQFQVFKTNGEISLHHIKYDSILLDIFNTEFHLRMLWGYRGSVVNSEERYEKFQKVLCLLHSKCNENL